MYLCIVGIIFSAYKLVAAAKEEEKVDQAFIEKEGQIYMERMEKMRWNGFDFLLHAAENCGVLAPFPSSPYKSVLLFQ